MLTDEQIEVMIRRHGTGGWQTISTMRAFARAIEQAARAELLAGAGIDPPGKLVEGILEIDRCATAIIGHHDAPDYAIAIEQAERIGMIVTQICHIAESIPAAVAAAKAEQPKWLPIETAPKDGTDILVFSPISGEQFVVYFKQGKWRFSKHGALLGEPTNWMPLPPPPSADAIREGAVS